MASIRFSPTLLIATVILLLALGGRVAAAIWWQQRLGDPRAFYFGDSASYWELGRKLARQQPYEYPNEDARVFRTPGYPVLLAPLFWLPGASDRLEGPPVLWGRWLGCLLGALSVLLCILHGQLLFDGRVGLTAGVLAACYPGAITMSVMVLSEAPFVPCLLAQFVCWTLAARASRCEPSKRNHRMTGWALAAGLMGGLATLMRPSWLLFLPFAGAMILLWAVGASTAKPAAFSKLLGERGTSLLRIGLLSCLGMIVPLAPWWYRNYQVTGHFVPTTLQVGASLYDGLSPQADGSSDMRFVSDFYEAQKQADASAGRVDGFEYRLDRRLRTAALDWAAAHPGLSLRLAGTKFVRMWNPWPNARDFRSFWLKLILCLGYVPLLILGLLGWGRQAWRGWEYAICLLPAVYFTLLHMVFVSSIRYRQPAMMVLLVFSASSLCWLWDIGSRCLLNAAWRGPTKPELRKSSGR